VTESYSHQLSQSCTLHNTLVSGFKSVLIANYYTSSKYESDENTHSVLLTFH